MDQHASRRGRREVDWPYFRHQLAEKEMLARSGQVSLEQAPLLLGQSILEYWLVGRVERSAVHSVT